MCNKHIAACKYKYMKTNHIIIQALKYNLKTHILHIFFFFIHHFKRLKKKKKNIRKLESTVEMMKR